MIHKNQIRKHRAGILKYEILLGCLLMTAMMGIAATMVHRINDVWKQGELYQFAAAELTNEMQRLTRLPRDKAQQEIDDLLPAEICRQRLQGAKLTGELSADDLGTRVTLELDWDRIGSDAQPVRLVGWLVQEESQ